MHVTAPSVHPALEPQPASNDGLPEGDVDMRRGLEIEGMAPSVEPALQLQLISDGGLPEGDDMLHGSKIEGTASIKQLSLEPKPASDSSLPKGDIDVVNNSDPEDSTVSMDDSEDLSSWVVTPPSESSTFDSMAQSQWRSRSPHKKFAQDRSPPTPKPFNRYHRSGNRSRSPYRGRHPHPHQSTSPCGQSDRHPLPNKGSSNCYRSSSPRRHFARYRSPSPRRNFTRYRSPPRRHFTRYWSPSPRRYSTRRSQSPSARQLRSSPSRSFAPPQQLFTPQPRSAHGWNSPIRSQSTLHLGLPSLVQLDPRRKAAIDYILTSFPPSATMTEFCNSSAQNGDVTFSAIPDHVLRHGRLTMPATTEIRLRYWHLRDPSAKLYDLLTRCVSKGLAFCIFLSNTFRTTLDSTLLRHSSQFVLDTSTRLIKQNPHQKVSPALVKEYLENVHEVLRRPQARRLVLYGGLLSRIVRQYAPNLYAEALLGPSAAAVDLGRLNVDYDGTHFTDLITPGEINMLLGLTTNQNTFWPYPEQYERSSKYNGEWSAANEAWFQRQAEAINYSKVGCLRSGVAWRNAIRPYIPEEYSCATKPGTAAHATACCAHLTKEWPELWDLSDFSSFE